jgi:hypothetical protein
MAATHLEAARALSVRAAELAAEAERARRLPPELSAAIADAGLPATWELTGRSLLGLALDDSQL